jgi:hypothetical protein
MTAEVSAPPTPWMNRAAISQTWFCATAQSSEAAVKIVNPVRNTRRCPMRSPSRPASSSSPPNAIRYAFTTQARLFCEKPRSRWIDGSATFTIVTSRTIIMKPAHSTYKAAQRERSVPAKADIWKSPS